MVVKGGKINDRYQIIRTLGEGGMANVYLAYDTILNRDVAVKVLRGDLANDEKFVRRFQREALSASSLSHPNIVEMYDVGEDDGQYYIVMEYVDGKTLKQLLKKRGHLTVTEVVDIMLQLTDGIAHAHDSYIIHRDIKPQNVMILENGLVKITDFGIAMALNSTQLTQTNSVMGSVHYIPPEQANGKGVTIRSDIYSMGILMYELLTGSIPYKGENAVEIALKHLKEPLPSIKNYLPDLPQSVENVIIKATAKNPQNRYADARAMYDDLKSCLDADRLEEDKYLYPYPEDIDKDEVKVAKKISKAEAEEPEKNKKKKNKTLFILLSIFTGCAVIAATAILVLTGVLGTKEVSVPDVTGLTQAKAEAKLEKAGLKVNGATEEITSEKVKEGKVVKTNPKKGKKVKKGKLVTLFISKGSNYFKMKDYIGKDADEIKDLLEEKYDVDVSIEEMEDETGTSSKNEIIAQEPKKGKKVKKGGDVILYIASDEVKYPDFTNGTYTLDEVRSFCKENSLTLNIEEIENAAKPSGTIVKQNVKAGDIVKKGFKLSVTVTKKPQVSSSSSSSSSSSEGE